MKRTLNIPKSKLCVVVVTKNGLARSYDRQRHRLCDSFNQVPKFRRPHRADVARQAYNECEAIWDTAPRLKIDIKDKRPHNIRTHASKLFASLFYVELRSIPRQSPSSITCEIDIKCRLAPCPHLNAIVHEIRRQKLQIYYTASQEWLHGDFCSSNWERITAGAFDGFSTPLMLEVASLDSLLQCEIDSPVTPGHRESIIGSSYKLCELVRALDDRLSSGRELSYLSTEAECDRHDA